MLIAARAMFGGATEVAFTEQGVQLEDVDSAKESSYSVLYSEELENPARHNRLN